MFSCREKDENKQVLAMLSCRDTVAAADDVVVEAVGITAAALTRTAAVLDKVHMAAPLAESQGFRLAAAAAAAVSIPS